MLENHLEVEDFKSLVVLLRFTYNEHWISRTRLFCKYQVVHEQKFKDLLSSTCQVSVERRVLDLESKAMRTFCYWILFHVVNSLMQMLALLPILSSL